MSGAGQPGGGSDPAMDDILASIRRILNEDEAQDGKAAEAEPLDLTEAMLVAAAPPPPEPEEMEPEPEPEPEPLPVAVAPAPEPAPVVVPMPPVAATPTIEGLIAPAVAAATTASLASLLRSVAEERSAAVHRGGPTIEDVVREEIRPLLKSWLDEHLPPLVERLVRAEIERVIGRAAP